ncbi:MAG: Ada metal-binding domain-containing protein [Candidatus Pseudobacter hemicellulosilyticus]|uniref:Ada metal-binding domain-containing protein n=1 Tax=Candidatus Pseudobacter hemicellulosilyticus TaxID=3121375 RepID=A0AAJ6BJV3_9BACT|nr:MAG: Ada metal-binding domain-containing protein [Pseudobacter sp.]
MIRHSQLNDKAVRSGIRSGDILYAGNARLNIYGLLSCASGKRMLRKNRFFFATVQEALDNGFRPCGHCMQGAYKIWKNGTV